MSASQILKLEMSEWIDSLRAVLQHRGTDRAAFLIE